MNCQSTRVRERSLYTISRPDRSQFVIYNASVIGNPADLVANKWYYRPYPVTMGIEITPAFDTAADAEEAARSLVAWEAGFTSRPSFK